MPLCSHRRILITCNPLNLYFVLLNLAPLLQLLHSSHPTKALLLCATTIAAAIVSSHMLPASEVLDTQSWSGSIISGLLLVGIVSFCCSSLLPCCRSQRQQISACPINCFHCRGWNGMYLGAEVMITMLTSKRLHVYVQLHGSKNV